MEVAWPRQMRAFLFVCFVFLKIFEKESGRESVEQMRAEADLAQGSTLLT